MTDIPKITYIMEMVGDALDTTRDGRPHYPHLHDMIAALTRWHIENTRSYHREEDAEELAAQDVVTAALAILEFSRGRAADERSAIGD